MLIKTYIPNKFYMKKTDSTYYSMPVHTFLKKKAKDCIEFDNDPVSGFTFYFTGASCYVIDPRGFCVIVTESHLKKIVTSSIIIEGELIGEYRWIFEDCSVSIIKNDLLADMDIQTEDDLLEAKITEGVKLNNYKLPDGEVYTYIGRYFNFLFSGRDYVSDNRSSPIYKNQCSIEEMRKLVFNALPYMYMTCDISNVYPEHVFVSTKSNKFIKRTKSFIAYEDLGESGHTEDYMADMMASCSCYYTTASFGYMVEFTKDFYAKPIQSKSATLYTMSDEDIEFAKQYGDRWYQAGDDNQDYVNLKGERVTVQTTGSFYSRKTSVIPAKPSEQYKPSLGKCMITKLKDGRTLQFTPFGVR